MNKFSIGFIEPHLRYGIGGIRRIVEIAQRLLNRQHNVIIFSPTGKPCRWLTNVIPTKPISELKNHKFDFSIFNLAEQYQTALSSNARLKIFFVLAPEAMYKRPDIPIAALRQNFMFMCNSTFTSNYIRKYIKVNYDIPIIPGGINPEHFKYDHSIPKEYHILYSGSKRPWKGTNYIETAFNGSKLKLLKMEGLNTPQQDMYKLYNKSTLFVSACLHEGFSFPELEAMACGCPVLCTDSGGNRDFIKSGKNAVVCSRDVTDLARKAAIILSDKNYRRALVIEGLKTANDPKYNWENIVTNFENVLISWL